MHLLMHQYLQKPSDSVRLFEVGDAIRFEWPIGEYTETLEVFLPAVAGDEQSAADAFLRLQAAPVRESDTQQTATESEAPEADSEPSGSANAEERVAVAIPQADRPGVYRIKRFPVAGETEEIWLALSVPSSESELAAADAAQMQQQPGLEHVRVLAANTTAGLSASHAGRELRWFLIGMLIAVLVCEQLLSLRLSFHPEVKS